MLFRDRAAAGELLAQMLTQYENDPHAIVLGLPRGGVVTAFAVAKKLNLPLDVTCPRKIGAPFNEEYAIGAVTETGSSVFNTEVIEELGISDEYLEEALARETACAKNRLEMFRHDMGPRELKGKVVILIDDGMATGSTIEAAIESVRGEEAGKVVVAVPVSPQDTLRRVELIADQTICLTTPSDFYAVGQFYEKFDQVEDQEVLELLKKKIR